MSTCGNTGILSIDQAPNNTCSVTLNYLPMGVSAIMMDPDNKWVTGLCSRSSSPNVTYTNDQNVTTTYYANKLWIVGSATGTNCPLHEFSGYPPGQLQTVVSGAPSSAPSTTPAGQQPTGELIIQNFSEDGSKVLYMCFLLVYVGSNAPPGGQIESLFDAVINKQTEKTVDFNSDIFGNVDPKAVYLEYNSVKLNKGAEVMIYSNPIRIGATMVNILQNNLGMFDMYNATYTTIPLSVPGSWMECEYVPLDSEEVAAYNLPLASDILENQSNQNSMKTIMTFIVFAILCGIAYAIVPDSYLFLVRMALGKGFKSPQQEVNRIFWLDVIMSSVILITAVTLIMVGAFANPQTTPNTGTILTAGLTMAILFVLCYIIVQSKKQNPNFLPGNITPGMTPII